MNEDPQFLRTRVRHQVLPSLAQAAGEEVSRRLAQFAAWAGQDEALLSELAAHAYQRLEVGAGQLDLVGVRAVPEPVRRRLLVLLGRAAGLDLDGVAIASALEAVATGGRCPLPRRLDLSCVGGLVRVVGQVAPVPWAALLELGDVPVRYPAWGLVLRLAADLPERGGGWALPLAERAGVCLRQRRRGERLAAGQVKLSDLLSEGRVPRELRDAVPVVVDAGDRVLGVVGVWPGAQAEAPPPGSGGPWLLASLEGDERAHPAWVRYTLSSQNGWRVARQRSK